MKNIFLVEREKNKARVLNPFCISVDADELKALADYLFEHYHTVVIEWNTLSVALPVSNLPYPTIKYNTIEDNIAELPDSYADYLNTLGRQTKKHAKYYVGRMQRDFPSVEYIYKNGRDVSDEEFYTVCRLASERMAHKSLKYGGASDEKLRRCIRHDAGFGFLVKIKGEVKAGCIGYVIGEHLYLSKIAHDVSMNKYNLGNVVLLKLIEYCINHHIPHFHFLWGKNVDYKVRFGGVAHPLTNYVIFSTKGLAYYQKRYDVWLFENKQKVLERLKRNDRLKKTIRRIRYFVTK